MRLTISALLAALCLLAVPAPAAGATPPLRAQLAGMPAEVAPGQVYSLTATIVADQTTTITATLTLPAGMLVETWLTSGYQTSEPNGDPASSAQAGAPHAQNVTISDLPVSPSQPLTITYQVRAVSPASETLAIELAAADARGNTASAQAETVNPFTHSARLAIVQR